MNIEDDREKILTALNKTGFPLEYEVCKILEKENWVVINNRYYIDDIKGIAREIDILAYKVDKTEEYFIYTALIISCKKSTEKSWCLFTKDLKTNINLEKVPYNNWTNSKVIDVMLEKEKFEDIFKKNKESNDWMDELFSFKKQVFGFQELTEKINGRTKEIKTDNDSAIFDSINTTIKALEYEKASMNTRKRKKEKYIYNFNLLSVFQGEMIEAYYEKDIVEPELKKLDSINYINRHIVNNEEGFYRVTFSKFDNFEKLINKFNELHNFNVSHFWKLEDLFYSNIFENKEYYDVFRSDFINELKDNYWLYSDLKNMTEEEMLYLIENIKFEYSKEEKKLYVIFSSFDDILPQLNNNQYLIDLIKDNLKRFYKYEKEFEFKLADPF